METLALLIIVVIKFIIKMLAVGFFILNPIVYYALTTSVDVRNIDPMKTPKQLMKESYDINNSDPKTKMPLPLMIYLRPGTYLAYKTLCARRKHIRRNK